MKSLGRVQDLRVLPNIHSEDGDLALRHGETSADRLVHNQLAGECICTCESVYVCVYGLYMCTDDMCVWIHTHTHTHARTHTSLLAHTHKQDILSLSLSLSLTAGVCSGAHTTLVVCTRLFSRAHARSQSSTLGKNSIAIKHHKKGIKKRW